MPQPRPLEERFWEKVQKGSECWEWQGARTKKGYGCFALARADVVDGSRMVLAHRLSWSLHAGPIPEGIQVLHRCDNPPCVNPEHLFLGSIADNMHDAQAKGRAVNPPALKGDEVAIAKLDDAAVFTIREQYASGEWNQYELAREYGVSQVLIGKIVRHDMWKHVGGPIKPRRPRRPHSS